MLSSNELFRAAEARPQWEPARSPLELWLTQLDAGEVCGCGQEPW